jgi:hypothetical protein
VGWLARLRSRIAALFSAGGDDARSARWAGQPGAPQFRLEPTANRLPDGKTVRLLMTFTQTSGRDIEASLRARWRGAGTDADYATPLVDIREHTYQTKAALADPEQTSDAEIDAQHVGFELAFELDGLERHCLWIWPLFQERDGRWSLDATSANTDQPARRW